MESVRSIFGLLALLVVLGLCPVRGQRAASIIEAPQNTTAPLGSNATFTCRVVGTIQWQAMGIAVVGNLFDLRGIFVTELQTNGDESFSILTVLASQENNNIPIQCIASVDGSASTAASPVVRLAVFATVQPQNVEEALGNTISQFWETSSLQDTEGTVLSRVGCREVLTCSGMGDMIKWRRFGQRMPLGNTTNRIVTVTSSADGTQLQSDLIYDPVMLEDRGALTCTISGTVSVTTTVLLFVAEDPAEITPTIPNFNLDGFSVGETLTVGCPVDTCAENVTVTFFKGENLVLTAEQDETETNVYNVNLEVNEDTAGTYSCRVDIPDFSVSQEFNITGTLSTVGITLTPNFGNQLGGVAVLVSGARFEEDDSVVCVFDGASVNGTFLNESYTLCVSPTIARVGRVPLQLLVNGQMIGDTVFITLDTSAGAKVDFPTDSSILFQTGSSLALSWNPNEVFPLAHPVVHLVDILLYLVDTTGIIFLGALATNIPNSGQVNVQLPVLPLPFEGAPITFQVAFSGPSGTVPEGNILNVLGDISGIGVWTTVGYLTNTLDFRPFCAQWNSSQLERVGQQILSVVVPCPPTLVQARLPNSQLLEDRDPEIQLNFFHPGAEVCLRSSRIDLSSGGSGQQCCYDSGGNLMIGPPGGGTVDRLSPSASAAGHFFEDTLPFIWCCMGLFPNCGVYYEHRPSDDSSRFRPTPPACAYGDPHIVTLDGHKYTFNGRGEFWLVQTASNFTLQGRMIEATDQDGAAVPATVVSALAVKEAGSSTVQFELQNDDLFALVDGERVDFSILSEQPFSGVVLIQENDDTLVAVFSTGVYLEARAESGFISTVFLSLPDSFRGQTQGLMGVFNGDANDDLLPRGSTTPIALNSSLQTIHESFGVTWIVDNEDDSLFVYQFGESWTTFFSVEFVPNFETVFSNATLEAEANRICGDDPFCLFDIAATGRREIGMLTLQGGQEFEEIVRMSNAFVCDPPCENGVCLPNNTCNCAAGFEGSRCTEIVLSECNVSPCQNGATCIQHASTFLGCQCSPGFIGNLCEVLIALEIHFVNDTPSLEGSMLTALFEATRQGVDITCDLRPRIIGADCSSGGYVVRDIPPGHYILRVIARDRVRSERDVIRRRIVVGIDDSFCTVILINRGVLVQGNNVTVEFRGTGIATTFLCILDRQELFNCDSPAVMTGLEEGQHHFKIIPADCGRQFRAQAFRFTIS